MKKGELASVTAAPEYGFGGEPTHRDLALVPANSTLIYEIEMVDFIKVISTGLSVLLSCRMNIVC
jgi:FK506-binding protein 4/5